MFWRNRKAGDFSDEIESHLQLETERLREQGLSEKDARAAARRAFGNVTQAQERFYESRRWLWWDHLCQDLRFAFRMLRKSPGFTVLAALCLALGTGVNTSVFALLDFTMLRPLPVPGPNRMTLVSRASDARFSYPDYLAYRDRGQTFAALAASFPTESSLDANEQSHLISAEAVSANYFQTMGIAPFIGRWFTDESEPAAVLSYSAWRNFFNGDPSILGKSVRSETQWYTVIGVASPAFTGINAPIQDRKSTRL